MGNGNKIVVYMVRSASYTVHVHIRMYNLISVSRHKRSSSPLLASASKFVVSVISFFTFCHSSCITLRSSSHCITWSASVISSGGGTSEAAARTKPVFSPDRVATSLYSVQNKSYCSLCQYPQSIRLHTVTRTSQCERL